MKLTDTQTDVLRLIADGRHLGDYVPRYQSGKHRGRGAFPVTIAIRTAEWLAKHGLVRVTGASVLRGSNLEPTEAGLAELRAINEHLATRTLKPSNRTGVTSASIQLDPVLLDYITSAYQGWIRAREYNPKANEPSIGIGELVGYVEQHNVVDTLKKANLYPSDSKYFRKYVRSAVETSVQRMLRQGLLVRSLGLVRSALGTTVHEAHVFEPKR